MSSVIFRIYSHRSRSHPYLKESRYSNPNYFKSPINPIVIRKYDIFVCPEARKILIEPNAGGKSIRSEALAMNILYLVKGARGVRTEMQVEYAFLNWKKCDFITTICNENVGVSVTRALPPPKMNPDYHDRYIAQLLTRKLYGLVVSRAGTVEHCAFTRSILFVWSPHRVISRIIQATFDLCMDPILKDDVELIIAEADEQTLRKDFSL